MVLNNISTLDIKQISDKYGNVELHKVISLLADGENQSVLFHYLLNEVHCLRECIRCLQDDEEFHISD